MDGRTLRTNSRVALLILACVGLGIAWVTVLSDPYYRASLAALRPRSAAPAAPTPVDALAEEARDPLPGTPLPRCNGGDMLRRLVHPGPNGVLVAAMGDCGSCCRLNLAKLLPQARRHGLAIVAFSDGAIENVEAFRQLVHRDGSDIAVVHDADHLLTRGINAYYGGRLYWYTPRWRLRWREQDTKVDNYLLQTDRFDAISRNTAP